LPTDKARKATTTAITLRQQVEHLLDDMETYTRDNLLKLCHMYILKCPADQELVEYGAISISNRDRVVMLDTQDILLFWQGSPPIISKS